jgi:hypothetical protein
VIIPDKVTGPGIIPVKATGTGGGPVFNDILVNSGNIG